MEPPTYRPGIKGPAVRGQHGLSVCRQRRMRHRPVMDVSQFPTSTGDGQGSAGARCPPTQLQARMWSRIPSGSWAHTSRERHAQACRSSAGTNWSDDAVVFVNSPHREGRVLLHQKSTGDQVGERLTSAPTSLGGAATPRQASCTLCAILGWSGTPLRSLRTSRQGDAVSVNTGLSHCPQHLGLDVRFHLRPPNIDHTPLHKALGRTSLTEGLMSPPLSGERMAGRWPNQTSVHVPEHPESPAAGQ